LANLHTLLGKHGREISGILTNAKTDQDQLEIARAYHRVLTSEPAAYAAWGDLLRSLSV
jgi:hypothetical protein